MKSNRDHMDFLVNTVRSHWFSSHFSPECPCVSLRPTTCVECVFFPIKCLQNPYFLNIFKPALFTPTFIWTGLSLSPFVDALCTLVEEQHSTCLNFLNFLLPMHQSFWFSSGLFYLLEVYELPSMSLLFSHQLFHLNIPRHLCAHPAAWLCGL